jgi:DnaJ C terminal domain
MRKYFNRITSLDDEHSIWVEEEELGNEKVFEYNNKRYAVKVPDRIDKKITVRLRELGKKRLNKTGDLYLHVWLNKGEDVNESIWISETTARTGADKRLMVAGKVITVVIPPYSNDGLTLRLKGCGREVRLHPLAPALQDKKKGNALVKLVVYPDSIIPKYGSFEALSTDNMALEGWVYRKIDEIIAKVGKTFFSTRSFTAEEVTDLRNTWGWRSIFSALVDRLNLKNLDLALIQSASISRPGTCAGSVIMKNNTPVGYSYKITINEQFLDNPFSIAAILAHELCHVVYSEKIEKIPRTPGYILKSERATLDEERTVDLLVFMFKIGEFQLRVARDKRLTLGYFNQDVFDRMQVIVSRKLNEL